MHCFDLLVVGGGINGAGIARDAAGRGLSVLLVDKGDVAGATSSISSKLIHGGLRYLEHYEFRLVAESLAEREVLLRTAGHLVRAARFVMPHVPELRPRWMIRLGLFLYDHLSRRTSLPGSQAVRLDRTAWGAGLKPEFTRGFAYSDCHVDDARLVIATARDAQARGATILTRTEVVQGRREGGLWHVTLRDAGAATRAVAARAVANVAGPWVKQVLNERLGVPSDDRVALVKGSHIVLPRRYAGEHAYILQNTDRRVIFMIPFEEQFTLIGTTDVPFDADPALAEASPEEVEYLCRAANRYLAQPALPGEIVWTFSGVRPLYDDGTGDPSSITRDYTLRLDEHAGGAPVLSVYGGKLTTYRRLAERALAKLAPYFPTMKGNWTLAAPLTGGDFGGLAPQEWLTRLQQRYARLPAGTLSGLFRRHGTLTAQVLGDARDATDLGEDFGAGLSEREVRHFIEHEWAQTADDVLWRRTKAGLHLDAQARERVARYVGR